MSSTSGYYRFPTLHGDHVVFSSEDDLWSVSALGGAPRRLSAHPGTSSHPMLSPDGRTLAYLGRDEGHPEIFVMDAEGGPGRRLTFLGAMTLPVAWRPNGRAVILASDFEAPFNADYRLYEVPLVGGPVKPVLAGPAMAFTTETRGRGVVIGRNTGDPARWKRYRGGTAGTLWIDRAGDGKFEKLVDLPSNLANPMWIGDRIYFLSDHEGIGNVYSVTPTGRNIRRHTDHEDYYVRHPRTDGRRIVYGAGADLFVCDPANGESGRIEVEYRSARPQRNRKFASAANHLEDIAVHPAGHSIALTSRGKLFSFPFWEGAVRQHGEPDGVRYRLARWLPGDQGHLVVSDESGEEELVIHTPGGAKRKVGLDLDLGRVVELTVSTTKPPFAAITNHRLELILVDLTKKRAEVVDRSPVERIQGPAFSPDGRWLAYARAETFQTTGIRLVEVATGESRAVTRPDFHDGNPSFSPDGEFLYFISYREFDPVYDHIAFDLGFPRAGKLMALPLSKTTPSPFVPKPRAPGAPMDGGGGPGEEKKKTDAPPKVTVDFPGIEDRVLAFPVPEGTYGRIAGMKGKVLFTSFPVLGSLSEDWAATEPPAHANLQVYDFAGQKQETLISGVSDFALAADAAVMVVRAGHRLRALNAGTKPEQGSEGKPAGRESGWLDLTRVRVGILPAAEWEQMMKEAWRLQRDQFWTEDMSGTDWKKVMRRYRPLLDRVASRAEFSDLLWEMQGELGTSHAYELGGDYRPEPAYHLGFLGADLGFDAKAKAWKVTRIPRGDSWREGAASPLAAPGLGLRAGSLILAIGGTKLTRKASPAELLVNRAGQPVDLLVADPGGRRKRTVTVKTLASEKPLRYRDWVEANREFVHRKTKGRVGYVHIPDMSSRGYAEFHRYYLAELGHEGLVVDVRYNGGGHVSPLILEKLLRRRIGCDTQRWGEPMPYPSEAPRGPIVALTNERAGSDGDIFSHCFKLFGIGPLIGKRTWGGVVGIWPRHALVDGTLTTQPEFSFWFEDVGYGVENYGTDPDIEVENFPQDYRRGRDRQMEKAIAEVTRLMEAQPTAAPDLERRPKLGLPRLPK